MRALAACVAGAAVLGLLWLTLSAVLASDRGLDMTDEGLYLLAADPPTRYPAFLYPWGWHTGPLFALVGYDIANFRTLGALLLVTAALFVGWLTPALILDELNGVAESRSGSAARALSALTGGVSVLLLYGGLQARTPGYNWLNLWAIMVSTAGFLALLRQIRLGAGRSNRLRAAAFAVVAGLGMFLSIPAKPSTPVYLAVADTLVLLALVRWRHAVAAMAGIVLSVLAWLGMAIILGLWPVDFAAVFVRTLQASGALQQQTVGGAAWNALGVPWETLVETAGISPPLLALVLSAAILLLIAQVIRRGRMTIAALAGLAGITAVLGIAMVIPMPGSPVEDRWVFRPLTLALVLLVALALGIQSVFGRDGTNDHSGAGRRAAIVLALYLSFLAFVFGFGSAHGTFAQASLAGGLLLLAAAAAGLGLRDGRQRLITVTVVTAIALVTTGRTLMDSRLMPFRMAPMSSQVVATVVGPRGATLLLDPATATTIDQLRASATAAGWKPGTPLLGLVWRWTSTIPYALGARVPDSLVLTVFGYPTSAAGAENNLRSVFADFPAPDAWILSGVNSDWPLDKASVQQVADSLASATHRRFPVDYVCVGSVNGLMLWRPSVASDSPSALGSATCIGGG